MKKVHLLDCITLVGHTPSTFDGNKIYVSTGAVDIDHILFADTELVSYNERPSRANLSAEVGDILFAKMASTEKTLRITHENADFLYSTGFCAVRAKQDLLLPECLYHLLASEQFLQQKDMNSSGATQKAITNAGMAKIIVSIPVMEEQKVLAKKLDIITRMIALRREELIGLDDLIKSRFIESFGDPVLNLNNLPYVQLSETADIVSGITKGRKTNGAELFAVPYMAVSNVKAGYIDWSTVKTIDATKNEIDQYRLLPFDVLMTEGGDPDKLGRGAIINNPPENCIHQNHIFRVRVNRTVLLPQYLEEYLQHQKAKQYFFGCAKQTTGIASINMKQLRALPVLLPKMELQKQFAAFVVQIDKSKLAVQEGLQELETLKKSLMQEYFG